jgi:hypothetical protein
MVFEIADDGPTRHGGVGMNDPDDGRAGRVTFRARHVTSPWIRVGDGLLVGLALVALMAVAGMVGAVVLGGDGHDAEGSELAAAVGLYQASLDRHDIAILEPVLDRDFTFHNVDFGTIQDRHGFLAWARIIGGAYPDFAVGVDGVRFEENVAVIRFHELRVDDRDLRRHGTPMGTVIMRVVDGRITDLWSNYSEFGLLHDRAGHRAATG